MCALSCTFNLGSPTAPASYPIGTESAIVFDVDGDGLQDLVTLNAVAGEAVTLHVNSATGGFRRVVIDSADVNPVQIAVKQFHIAVAYENPISLKVFRISSDLTFVERVFALDDKFVHDGLVWTDANLDGVDDVVAFSNDERRAWWYNMAQTTPERTRLNMKVRGVKALHQADIDGVYC